MTPESAPEHHYAATLHHLASAVDVKLPETMEGMDDYLADVGWRPSVDALRRLSINNAWVATRL
ncbi:hypothetical protein QOZ75_29800, partial [Pseudomonas aeruginosa]|uniref:hypothetical protein n=1 Tax=Pseudomonas aeruginosa TaxID=287 RepID=UPI00345913C1